MPKIQPTDEMIKAAESFRIETSFLDVYDTVEAAHKAMIEGILTAALSVMRLVLRLISPVHFQAAFLSR